MFASNHVAAKVAIPVAAVLTTREAASVAARYFGTLAGAVLTGAVFAACWLVHRVRPMLHPVPLARRSGSRDPEVTAETVTLAGTAASR